MTKIKTFQNEYVNVPITASQLGQAQALPSLQNNFQQPHQQSQVKKKKKKISE